MSKRNLALHSEDAQPSKKQRTSESDTNPLLALADRADDLIEALQSLKSWRAAVDPQDKSTLSPAHHDDQLSYLRKVSHDVLPSLSALAGQSNTQPTQQHIPLDSPWVSSEISDQLPPLPHIKDAEVEAQAFRHPAILHEGPNYERLEWLGDAYLENISTCFILATFSDLPSGRCAQIRERLIRNVQLSRYFVEYGLMPKANVPPEVRDSSKDARGRSSDKDMIKVQADMFEAYVGGIITADPENGVHIVSQWMKAVWGRTIKADVVSQERKAAKATQDQELASKEEKVRSKDQGETQKPNPMLQGNSKSQLAYAIAVPGVEIKYEDVPCTKNAPGTKLPLFSIKISLYGHGEAGLFLGGGTALKKKEAGTQAADQALRNWKLVSKFRDAKAAHLNKAGQTDEAQLLLDRTRHLDDM